MSHIGECSRQQGLRRLVQLVGVVATEQVSVGVEGHGNRRVAEPHLHVLRRKAEPSVLGMVHAPARVEVPQGVKAGVFGRAILGDDFSRHHGGDEAAPDDVLMKLHSALAVGEHQLTGRGRRASTAKIEPRLTNTFLTMAFERPSFSKL